MVIREINLSFDYYSDVAVPVPVGECRLTFDEAEAYNGIREDFRNTVTSEELHRILEQKEFGEEVGRQFMDTKQLTDFLKRAS